MPEFEPGLYVIYPKFDFSEGFGIGPITTIHPPPDVPVRLLRYPLLDKWAVQKVEDRSTFTVSTGKGQPDDYKWVLRNETDLYVSSEDKNPASFRLESAGDDHWKIALPEKDAVLTHGKEVASPLTFKPSDGSDAQLFRILRVLRDD